MIFNRKKEDNVVIADEVAYSCSRGRLFLFFGCFLPVLFLILEDAIVWKIDENENTGTFTTKTGTTTTSNSTISEERNGSTSSYRSVSPRQMEIKYFEMWDHHTSTMDDSLYVPGNNLRYPFYDGVPSSLEILESVLHGPTNREEYSRVNEYIKTGRVADNKGVPQCLMPDTQSTSELANEILEGKRDPITLPLLNVGFPKCGSTTLNDYFNCIGIPSNHGQNGGKIMKQTRKHQQLLTFKIDNESYVDEIYPVNEIYQGKLFPSYMELNFNYHTGFYPQIQLLDELHEEAPNSTFILNFRPIKDWIRSVTTFRGSKKNMRSRFGCFTKVPGLILTSEQRIERKNPSIQQQKIESGNYRKCSTGFFVDAELTDEQLARWVCDHVKHIREYVKLYPSHRLIELDLYNTSESSNVLYNLFQATSNYDSNNVFQGIDGTQFQVNKGKKCWGHSNQQEKFNKQG